MSKGNGGGAKGGSSAGSKGGAGGAGSTKGPAGWPAKTNNGNDSGGHRDNNPPKK